MRKDPFEIEKPRIHIEDCHYVGANVPRQVADHFALLGILHQRPKTHEYRVALETFLKKEEKMDLIVNELVKRAYLFWITYKKQVGQELKDRDLQKLYEGYKEQLFETLSRRGVSRNTAKLIISQLNSLVMR